MNYSVVLYRKLIASMLKSCVIRCLFMTLLFHNVHQLYLFEFVFSKRPHPFLMHPVKTMQSFVTMCFLPYLRLQACCKSLHDGVDTKGKFPNPETLTRARYSSFALGLASYVIDTTHPFHRGDLFLVHQWHDTKYPYIHSIICSTTLIIYSINIEGSYNAHDKFYRR